MSAYPTKEYVSFMDSRRWYTSLPNNLYSLSYVVESANGMTSCCFFGRPLEASPSSGDAEKGEVLAQACTGS